MTGDRKRADFSRRSFMAGSGVAVAGLSARAGVAHAPGAGPAALVDAINPIIGATTLQAAGEGKTFPGAATPFGAVQLSPDTVTGGDNASGYTFEDHSIEGFSFNHLSGVGWYGDMGNLQVMPSTGDLMLAAGRREKEGEGWRSAFRHETEQTHANYYAVTLDRYAIRAEATAAPRAGMLRFTYPKSSQARIQVNLVRRIGGFSTRQFAHRVSETVVEGWVECTPQGGGWGNGAGGVDYRLFFRMEFSRAPARFGFWSIPMPDAPDLSRELASAVFDTDAYQERARHGTVETGIVEKDGANIGFFAEFETRDGEQVLLKAGISYVDVAGARANLARDIPDWNFERTRGAGRSLWAGALDKIRVEGGTPSQRAVFATACYHAMIDPRVASDADGRFRRGDGAIGQSSHYTRRTVFSGWDVYRGLFPLMTIIDPQLVVDQINSLVDLAQETRRGYLERWELLNAYSGCMSGDPATAIILDAHVKGLKGFDVERAYAACRQTATGVGDATNRADNGFYMEHGFVPGLLSQTLGRSYFDWCAGMLARSLGHQADSAMFLARAQNYRHVYDPGVESMRALDAKGQWLPWEGRTSFGQGCEESNPGQESFAVPHDIAGLVALMGRERFDRQLDDLFERAPANFAWNPYYNHANEPVHHLAYLFACTGRPWLTQKWVRRIMDGAYQDGVSGLVGNDDVGQMSGWFILSAIGFYPVCPGDGTYVIGTPLFPNVEIDVGGAGRRFRIHAPGASSDRCYIAQARLNGRPHDRCWLTHGEIMAGGLLELVMSSRPNPDWGVRNPLPTAADRPLATSQQKRI